MNIPNDDPIEIEIVDDETPKEPEIVVQKDEQEPPKGEIDNGLEALKAQLESEKRARIEAEKRANEASQSAYHYQNEAQDTNLHLVTNAIETVTQSNAILKANYRDAMANQDYDMAAEIQEQMSANAAKLLQLEQGRQALESAPKVTAPEPFTADPVEALASQLSPRSADWVRRHPEYATNPRLYQKMIAAHQLAISDGIDPDTNDYFESIESTLRIRSPEVDDAMEYAAKPVQRRASPPAAPVSRGGTPDNSRPHVVRLTPAERESAEISGQTYEEYARNKMALRKEGRLN